MALQARSPTADARYTTDYMPAMHASTDRPHARHEVGAVDVLAPHAGLHAGDQLVLERLVGAGEVRGLNGVVAVVM